ncbi:MAG: flagellar hook-associated protein FlgK [Gammaproteobacteria bacterium]|nr:flagellar hook-associated protein FlgK [Gammaproteobacteria bacterium]
MSSGDFLSIGISGLMGSQAAITTTSHNIANINTEGFNRQSVDFGTNISNFFGGSYIGTGVVTNNVERILDSLAVLDFRSNITNFSSLDTFVSQADRIDSIVADPTTGLSPAIQNFFEAMQAVADDPSSTAVRQSLFSQTDLIIGRFQSLDEQLNNQRVSINDELSAVADQVTTIGSAIATINHNIVEAIGASSTGALPNDLLDKRDLLLIDLSELVKVSTVDNKDGSTSVFIGNGQSLVIGSGSSQLIAEQDPDDPLNSRISFVQNGTAIPVTREIVGGTLGGLIDYRNELLTPAINRLGLVAMGLADSINVQHQKGLDLNSQLGGLFFNDIHSTAAEQNRVVASTENTGSGVITMTITDVSMVSVSDYTLSFDGVNYTLRNNSDNSTVTSFADPGVATVAITDASGDSLGFSLNFTGSSNTSDSYMLTPTRSTVGLLDKAITDLSQIAAASPVKASADMNNAGSAEISSIVVTNSSSNWANPLTWGDHTIVFTDDVTFEIRDSSNVLVGSPATYTPNQENNMIELVEVAFGGSLPAGWDFEIAMSGTAIGGDTFTIEFMEDAKGDNTNALAMAALQTENILNNGTTTIQGSYGLLVSEIGTRTNEAKISYGAAQSLLRQTEARVQETSGVNLDEEAAKLIKYQQSYQASAQIINTAKLLFDTLISSV